LLISDVVQNAMIGNKDDSVGGAADGVIMLLMLSFALNQLTSRSRRARKILERSSTLLV
jgi:uncharacterized membrane protein YcaP (DUF421 family)